MSISTRSKRPEAAALTACSPSSTLSLVQPNMPQAEKWLPEKQQAFFERHLSLTAQEPRPDVTIWSETAVPFALDDRPDLLAASAAAAAPGRLVLGIVRAEPGDPPRWFNSLAVLDPAGAPVAVYDKHHLVPFGEYIPLPRLVAALGIPSLEPLTRSGFTAGSGPHLVQVPGLPAFLPLICYEAIFPGGLAAPEGRADWLVQVTNDAWFGAWGPPQHLAQARLRAIEEGLPVIRSTPTGISAVIDADGRVVKSLPPGKAGRIDAHLPVAKAPTLFARYGNSLSLAFAALLIALTFIPLARRPTSR